jgi:hypothetical protein
MFDGANEASCSERSERPLDEADEVSRSERSERRKRPLDPAVVARAAGRFTPERPPRSSSRKRRKRRKRRRRSQSARAPPDAGDGDKDAYSIQEFCRRHAISESFYHKLRNLGLGPKTMAAGKRRLITREAARQWRRERERAAAQAD